MINVFSAGLVGSERLPHCPDSWAEVLCVTKLPGSAGFFAQLRFPDDTGDEAAKMLHAIVELGASEFMLGFAFG